MNCFSFGAVFLLCALTLCHSAAAGRFEFSYTFAKDATDSSGGTIVTGSFSGNRADDWFDGIHDVELALLLAGESQWLDVAGVYASSGSGQFSEGSPANNAFWFEGSEKPFIFLMDQLGAYLFYIDWDLQPELFVDLTDEFDPVAGQGQWYFKELPVSTPVPDAAPSALLLTVALAGLGAARATRRANRV